MFQSRSIDYKCSNILWQKELFKSHIEELTLIDVMDPYKTEGGSDVVKMKPDP